MEHQRYILTIQNDSIFREIDVSEEVVLLRIGTLQECDVRLKRELFEIPVCVTLHFQNGTWYITGNKGTYLSSRFVKSCSETAISHGDIVNVHSLSDDMVLFTMEFSYDFTVSASNFDTIVDIRNQNQLLIGPSSSAQLRLTSHFVGEEYLFLNRGMNGKWMMDASHAQNSATLNGIRQFGTVNINEMDFIGIADYSFYFKNQVLYTTKRKDLKISGILVEPLREETPAFTYPKLNRSPRMMYAFQTEPIEILNPPSKPDKPRDNLVLQAAPALLMIAVVVVTRSGLIGGTGSNNIMFLIYSMATMAVGLLTTLMSFVYNKKKYKKDLEEWNADYATYIARKRMEIEAEQVEEIRALNNIYPSSEDARNFVKGFSGRLFERTPRDTDFLFVRVGLGDIPAIREITCRQEEHIKVENELMEIPPQLQQEYALLKGAPVLLHLREAGSVGVIGSPNEQYEFFKNMILDICVQHDYEEVEIVVMLPHGQKKRYEWIKWLPHLKKSGGSMRGIVCDDESRDNVLEHLYALMTKRETERVENETIQLSPHMVVFVLEEYGIKTHPLFKYAENAPELGFSFVFFKEYKENLPRYCMEIVDLREKRSVVRLKRDKRYECAFQRETVRDESIQFVSERLAPIYCEKIALSSRLTANISLFELLNILSPEDLNLLEWWEKSNVQKSMAAPLGIDVKGTVIKLDLHEKAHGPHGLVAGTTGSGKSEIMQSYILSAAVNFHPYDVGFVIIDFKGGGMANQFENLPHLVGKITDIDSHEMNRSLLSIRAELEKRKRLFAEFGVNHIDQYIAKYHVGTVEIPLPHLILIVDEFAELKAEQPEFMKELISTARIGRSLGIHLILATQKPAGQVNEQIWSNSRFKLCLKVATKEDSNEVLRSPLASEIREPGRAYLQVGNNEIFTLFQSAYSGASAVSDPNGKTREFKISEVDFTGKRSVVYEKKAKRDECGQKITQLKAMVDYIESYCKRYGISKLPDICMPPLPERILYETDNTARERTNGIAVTVGIYDDPANQMQPKVTINLASGNVIVIGSAQSGKTMLLQMILRGIAEQYAPGQISVYVLDFASKILKMYENLNHVGAVLTDADDEKLKNFFKLLREELSNRKEYFARQSISSYEAYLEMREDDEKLLPRIIVMIDNLSVFKEAFQEYEEDLLNLCREGLALGITIIATAKQTMGLSYKYLSNFGMRLSFHCTENTEYSNVFDRCQLRPKNVQGRGLVTIDKVVYEYQAYLPFDGETESKRMEQARGFIKRVTRRYGNERAREVPSIPAVLTGDYWENQNWKFRDYEVPVGLTYREIEPVTIDLARVGTVGIYGREGFGKSNLVRILLNYLQRHVFDLPCQAYLLDGYERQLAEFETYGFVEQYTIDCGDFEDMVQRFADTAEERMEILKMGGDLENEPLLLCVVQNSQIYESNQVSRAVCERFKKLVVSAKQMKFGFIFTNVENNSEYSPSDMMKLVREFDQFFLLDDMANVKLFGSSKFNVNELKQFKKQIVLGDGYTYDPRNGIEKIKLVKCDREEDV